MFYMNEWNLSISNILFLLVATSIFYLASIYLIKRTDEYEFKKTTYLLGYFATVALWMVFYNFYTIGFLSMLIGITFVVLVLTIIVDFKYYEIPNEYNLILAIVGLMYAVSMDNWWQYIISGLLLFVVFLIIMVISGGGLGAGDVKMVFGIGLLIGTSSLLSYVIYTFLIASIISIILIAFRIKGRKDRIAFGPYLAIGYFIIKLPIILPF